MSLIARRLAFTGFVSSCVLLWCLSLLAGTALAAAPEAPLTESASSVGANKATLNGELNPKGLANTGWYFAIKKGGACLGEGTVGGEGVAPVKEKKVFAEAGGLEPGTSYSVCLVAYNEVGEDTVGSSQSFTTAVSQPVIDSEQASVVARSTATLEAQVNPEKQTTNCLRFEYGETGSYGKSISCTPGSLGASFGDQLTSANVTGLKPDTIYHFRVVVENPSSPVGGTYGPDQSFTTHPAIQGSSFSGVSSRSATLSANLNVYDAPFAYHFEYGTTSAYGSSTPVVSSGNAAGEATVTTTVEGLSPSAEYHFRIVAEDANGEITYGADMDFITLPAGIQGLPDKRVYEMVTPIEKEDAEVYVPYAIEPSNQAEEYFTRRINEVAADGDRVVYQADPTHAGEGESSGNGLGSTYLSTRSAGGGWTQASIQPAGRRLTFYRGFSRDLSVGVLGSLTENAENAELPLPGADAPPSTCSVISCIRYDLYKHSIGEEDYQALFATTPKRATGEFGATKDNGTSNKQLTYAGGSTDMNHLLFEANDALLEGEGGAIEHELDHSVEQEIAESKSQSDYLYDWNEGHVALVDVLPNGTMVPDATFGAPHSVGAESPGNPPDFSHVISSDGSHVFWSSLEGEGTSATPKGLYVRENPSQPQSPINGQGECSMPTDACTIQLDSGVGGGGRFWTASSDGMKVFFTKGGLYEYEINPIAGKPGVLTDLTPGIEVQGVLGAAEDGNYVYYADNNDVLHLLHEGSGGWEAPVSIATLSPQDGSEVPPFFGSDIFTTNEGGLAGDWVPSIGERTAEVTADGQGLVFMSRASLKAQGFPNGYANNGGEEVYVYNAAVSSLFCASCSQSDEPASGGFIPVSWSDSYIPTLISEGGNRVFFDSGSALVSRDTNGLLDAYEWEREGSGSCLQGEGTDGGCVYLLSGGTSNEPSYLLGASPSGSDVFMITRGLLTSDAEDELFKVFDARIEGFNPPSPPACTGTGCQGVPSAPPTFATPSSVTYSGVGNFPPPVPVATVKAKSKPATRAQKLARALKACRAKRGKRRTSCEAKARSRYGSKGKAGRSGSKRGRK